MTAPLKVAIIGSAPSSVQLAPYNDLSWRIWSVSPGAYPHVKRCDVHFEVHRWEPPDGYTGPKPWFTVEYIDWMRKVPQVFMIEPVPELPNSIAYPKDAILEQFGPYWQTSTVTWMVCLAVAAGAKEIGLWGIDMAAVEEWQFQRTGLQCLLWYVHKHYGVKITLPPESDLWAPPVLYGFADNDPHTIKIARRRAELDDRATVAQQKFEAARAEMMYLQGAKADNDYHLHTWCQDPKAIELSFCQPEPYLKQKKIAAIAEALAQPTEALPNGHAAEVAA